METNFLFKLIKTMKKLLPTGSSCTYIKLTPDFGIKCYYGDEWNRNYAYDLQKKLCKKKLAPKAYAKFHFKISRAMFYCYLTEHAKTKSMVSTKVEQELIRKLNEAGYFSTFDVRSANIGFIKKRAVLIDCDFNSFS